MEPKPGQPVPAPTRLESDDDIRQALQARRARQAAKAPAVGAGDLRSAVSAGSGDPRRAQEGDPRRALEGEPRRAQGAQDPRAAPVPVAEAEPLLERPVERPPMALLCILDDGKADGEWVRLRAERTLIGRTEGDVRIPHDGLMSGRHAELVRQRGPKGYRWSLVDLQSTNGTFVRCGSTGLRHGDEVLIGRGRFRFEAGATAGSADVPGDAPQPTTQAWTESPVRSLVASLVELTPAGPVHRVHLTLPEYWLGRDQACTIARTDDFLLNARHARLFRDGKGQWLLENHQSTNGVWLRITAPMPLGRGCQFRLGEQRFIFRMA